MMANIKMIILPLLLVLGLKAIEIATSPKNMTNVVCYLFIGNNYTGQLPPDLNTTVCTHLIYISSSIIDDQLAPSNPKDIPLYYSKIPLIKKMNPHLTILLSAGDANFPESLGSAYNRSRFANSTVPFLRKYGFDGLDLDYEFPGWLGQPHGQVHNFSLLLMTIRSVFDGEKLQPGQSRLLLTAAIPGVTVIIDVSFEVPYLAKTLDFINLMCYDYHFWEWYDFLTGFNSPLYPEKNDLFITGSVAFSADYIVKKGMPKSKVMVGIPVYGHTYKLLSADVHGVHAPAVGPGSSFGEYISYPQVCQLLKNNAIRVFDNQSMVPYLYQNKLWVSYDDEQSTTLKVKWIKDNGFHGVMVYSMDSDDYMGSCDGKTKFPLLTLIRQLADSYWP